MSEGPSPTSTTQPPAVVAFKKENMTRALKFNDVCSMMEVKVITTY